MLAVLACKWDLEITFESGSHLKEIAGSAFEFDTNSHLPSSVRITDIQTVSCVLYRSVHKEVIDVKPYTVSERLLPNLEQ